MVDKDKADPGDKPQGRRIDLSFAQVAGSAVAAVCAAVLAGQLGVYGTFLGAGVVSVVATTGGPVFQHFFRRTGEQIKDRKVPVQPKGRRADIRDAPGPGTGDTRATALTATVRPPAGEAGADEVTRVAGPPERDDPERTRLLRTVAPERRGPAAGPPGDVADVRAAERTLALRPGPAADRTQALRTDDVTRVLTAHGGPRAGGGQERAAGEEPEEYTTGVTRGTRWRGWKRTLLPAVLVFVIAVGGITLFEAVSDHNISHGKGTSVGRLFHGDRAPAGETGTDDGPAPTPSPSAGDGSSPSGDDGQGSGSPAPSDGPGAGEAGHGRQGSSTGPTPTPTDGTDPSGDGSGDSTGSSDDGGQSTGPGASADPGTGNGDQQGDEDRTGGNAGDGQTPGQDDGGQN